MKNNGSIRDAAIRLTIDITSCCDNIKNRPVFVNQILKSCSSIGANVSEAKYAQSNADFVNKLEIALKECYETQYWLEILFRTLAITDEQYKRLMNQCGSIRRKLISAITKSK